MQEYLTGHWYLTPVNKAWGYNEHFSMTDTYILGPNGKCAISSVEKYKTEALKVFGVNELLLRFGILTFKQN